MNNMVTTNKAISKEVITKEKIVDYMNAFGIAGQLSASEKNQFIEIATAYQLNPFLREIYCIPYGKGEVRKLSIITGYEVYIKRAERIGVLDGWDVEIVGESLEKAAARITIYRKDWKHPFKHIVYLQECKQESPIWRKMPRFMLKKVAIAQGFRLCFSDEFGGMPYTADELPEEMTNNGYNEKYENDNDNRYDNPAEIKEAEVVEPQKQADNKEFFPEHELADGFSAPAPENKQTKEDEGEPRMLKPGEKIPGWFWDKTAIEKAKYIPDGCKYAKVDGVWKCIKAE